MQGLASCTDVLCIDAHIMYFPGGINLFQYSGKPAGVVDHIEHYNERISLIFGRSV